MKIREQNDYTLGQYVVMLSGERITNMGLHENIKLTEKDLIQLLEWLKLHQPKFLAEVLMYEPEFYLNNNVLDDDKCLKLND
jgi:hypothetical protein